MSGANGTIHLVTEVYQRLLTWTNPTAFAVEVAKKTQQTSQLFYRKGNQM